MKFNDISGQLISLVTTGIAIVVAFLVAFHIIKLSTDETNAITNVAIAGIALGLYVWSLLHSWANASYDLPRVTTLLTAVAAAVMAFLTAFGVFNFDAQQQAAVLGLASGLAFIGGLVFSYLHTSQQVLLRRAIATVALAQKVAQQPQMAGKRR